MIYEWNENKRQSNLNKHGFDFIDIDVWQLFEGEHTRGKAKQGSNGEQRFLATGFVHGVYATVIYTTRDGATRVISLRKARKNERKQHQTLHDG